jgi:ATP-dependent Clp protease ATP-binding subunit ClpA
MMFERFTRTARAAVVLAQEEARDLDAREIGTEHLLVGVLQSAGRDLAGVLSGFGLTAEAVRSRLAAADSDRGAFDDDAESLRAIGIDLHAVRAAVERGFGPDAFGDALRRSGRRRRRRGHIPFAKAAKKTLELALREALAHKSKEIGSEHVLLAILRGGDPVAVGIVTEHVSADQLRTAVESLLDKAA